MSVNLSVKAALGVFSRANGFWGAKNTLAGISRKYNSRVRSHFSMFYFQLYFNTTSVLLLVRASRPHRMQLCGAWSQSTLNTKNCALHIFLLCCPPARFSFVLGACLYGFCRESFHSKIRNARTHTHKPLTLDIVCAGGGSKTDVNDGGHKYTLSLPLVLLVSTIRVRKSE